MVTSAAPTPTPLAPRLRGRMGPVAGIALLLLAGAISAQTPAPERGSTPTDPATSRPGADGESGDDPAELPSKEERARELRDILENPTPEGLDRIEKLLESPEEDLRIVATRGVIARYPDECFDFFRRLVREGNAYQREAAGFGLAYSPDPRSLDVLLNFIASKPPGTPDWVGKGSSLRLRSFINGVHNRVLGTEPLPDAELEALFERARTRLMTDWFSAEPGIGESLEMLRRRLMTYPQARELVGRFAAAQRAQGTEDAATLANCIEGLSRANRSWLGRPEVPDVERVSYTFNMINYRQKQAKEKSFAVSFTPRDADLLRFKEDRLLRAVKWELPLDELARDPRAANPRLVSATDEKATFEYSLIGAGLSVGVGSFNIAYWANSIAASDDVRVRAEFDRQRYVVTHEKIIGSDGAVRATIDYGDYAPVGDRGLAPRSIRVALFAGDRGTFQARYDARFEVREPDVWLLVDVDATELDERRQVDPATGEERVDFVAGTGLAHARLSDVRVEKKPSGDR